MTKKTTRIRTIRPVIDTRADAEKCLGELAADQATLNQLKANLDAEITALRQSYEGDIDRLGQAITQRTGLLQSWAEANPDEFSKRKSIDFIHGTLGFRTGQKQVKTRPGWTFKKVLDAIGQTWTRIKRELDKEGILSAYQRGDLDDMDLKEMGLRIVQDEAFFVEPKVEDIAA